jgi:hypothetical protein
LNTAAALQFAAGVDLRLVLLLLLMLLLLCALDVCTTFV